MTKLLPAFLLLALAATALAAPPANDNFAAAQSLGRAVPLSVTGTNVGATLETGEGSGSGGASVWYNWTAPSSGPFTVTTWGSGFDTILSLYTGNALASLTLVGASDDDSSSSRRIQFTATEGITYRIAVRGSYGTVGTIQLALSPTPANDNFAAAQSLGQTVPLSVTGTNVGASREAGEPDAFTIGGASAWYKWTAPYSGSFSISTLGSDFEAILYLYTGNALASLTLVGASDGYSSSSRRIQFNATARTTYRIAVQGYYGAVGTIQLALTRPPQPPTNDNFAAAQSLGPAVPLSATGTNVGATLETGEESGSGGASVWYNWTAPSSGSFTVSTLGSDFDTILDLYTGNALASLTLVGASDDDSSSSRRIQFTATEGITYRIAVRGSYVTVGTIQLALTRPPQPPTNDNFAAAQSLGPAVPLSATGTNVGATLEAGEASYSGRASVWYNWTAPSSGPFTVTTWGSDFDTILSLYTGNAPASLTPIYAAGYSSSSRQIQFNATAGITYRIAVRGSFGARAVGTIQLALTLITPPANDNFAAAQLLGPAVPLSVTGTNVGATLETGEESGSGGASVWYNWTAPSSGSFTVSTLGSDFDTILSLYTGKWFPFLTLIGESGEYSSSDSRIQFNATARTTYRIKVRGSYGAVGTIQLALTPSPANDSFAAAQSLGPAVPLSVTGTNVGASLEAGEPDAYDKGGASVWYNWTAPSSGSFTVSTLGSDFDTSLYLYTGNALASLTLIGAWDNDFASWYNDSGSSSRIQFKATAGITYRIAVHGHKGAVGTIQLTLTLITPSANDNFAAAQSLGPAVPLSVTGTNVAAGLEADEPNAFTAGGASVWYNWTAPSSGSFTVSTLGSNFDTILYLYTGNALASLTLIGESDDDSGVSSRIQFNATAGITYRVAVHGYDGDFGTIQLALIRPPQPPANDDFTSAETLAASPSVSSSGSLECSTLQVASEEPDLDDVTDYSQNSEDGKTVWYTWTAPMGVAWAQVKLTGINVDNRLSVYTGDALGSLSRIAQNDRTVFVPNSVTFQVIPATVYHIRVASYLGSFLNYGNDLDTASVEAFTLTLRSASDSPVTVEERFIRGLGRYQQATPAATLLARDDFAAVIAAEPGNHEARFKLALSQLLALEGETGFAQLLAGLGIPLVGNFREQGYPPTEDIDGYPVLTAGANTTAVLDYLKNIVLPRLLSIDSTLAGITENNFLTAVEKAEAGKKDYAVDRGDVLVIKSTVHGMRMLIEFLTTYNLAVPLQDLTDLKRDGELSAERVLETYQNLLKFSGTDRRAQLIAALRAMEADYEAADDFIQNTRILANPNPEFGFFQNLEAQTFLTAQLVDSESPPSVREKIGEVTDSLDGPRVIDGEMVDFSKFANTTDSLRDWLPPFFKNGIIGSMPKPSFGGIFPDNTTSKSNDALYDLGLLYGMSQYTQTIAGYLEEFGYAHRPGDNPDGDADDNFKEYLFGTDPTVADTIYQGVFQVPAETGKPSAIQFSYIRAMGLVGWRLVVEVSDDLSIWDETEAQVEQVDPAVPTGDGFSETVTYRLISNGAVPEKKFFRVKAQPHSEN